MQFASIALFLNGVTATPVQLIVDTDLGFDVDDAGALAIANHLQDIGECEIIAVVHNTGFDKGIGGVDSINTWYKRNWHKPLQLGAYTGPWGSHGNQDRYTSLIESKFPSDIQKASQVYSATKAYQEALKKADNASVVIASIGELTNLRDIIKADKDLFTQKVKAIYYMDGGYNFGCGDSKGSGKSPWLGSTKDCDGAAQFVIEQVPHSVAQYFTGNGGNVQTGGRFNDHCGAGPVKLAYKTWTNSGTRSSWDLMAVYFAVRGAESLFSYAEAGTNQVDYYGNEHFDTTSASNNEFNIHDNSSRHGDIASILNDMLCAAPCRSEDAKFGGCDGYELQASRNCYASHGADDIDASTSAGTMTLSKCQAVCDQTAGCTGVAMAPAPEDSGLVRCYRKKNIEIGKCAKDHTWDTWVKKNVAQKTTVII